MSFLKFLDSFSKGTFKKEVSLFELEHRNYQVDTSLKVTKDIVPYARQYEFSVGFYTRIHSTLPDRDDTGQLRIEAAKQLWRFLHQDNIRALEEVLGELYTLVHSIGHDLRPDQIRCQEDYDNLLRQKGGKLLEEVCKAISDLKAEL
jgi:hypothetical protein